LASVLHRQLVLMLLRRERSLWPCQPHPPLLHTARPTTLLLRAAPRFRPHRPQALASLQCERNSLQIGFAAGCIFINISLMHRLQIKGARRQIRYSTSAACSNLYRCTCMPKIKCTGTCTPILISIHRYFALYRYLSSYVYVYVDLDLREYDIDRYNRYTQIMHYRADVP